MSSGVRAASVFASFGINTEEWTKGLAKVVSTTVKALKDVENIGRGFAKFGTMITAPIVLALRAAAKNSPEVQAQLDRVQRAFAALAGEIARAVLPIVKQFADTIAGVARWLHDMDPHTKAAIFGFVEMAAKVALVAAALGQMASVLGLVMKGVALMLGPMGAVLGTIAVLVVAAAVIREAWEENLWGIQQVSVKVWNAVKNGAGFAVTWMAKQFHDGIKGMILGFLALTNVWRTTMAALGHGDRAKIFDEASNTIVDILKTVDEIPQHLTKDLAVGAKAVAGIVERGAGHLLDDAGKLIGKLGKLGAGLFGPSGAGGLPGTPGSGKIDQKGILSASTQGGALAKLAMDDADELNKRLEDATKDYVKQMEKAEEAMRDFVSGLGQMVTSRMGTAGQLANSAAQGMTTAGPWGAVIAVFIDLVTRSKQFVAALEYVEKGCQMLADTFGRLFGSGSKINEASNNILEQVMTFIAPIFDMISDMVGEIAPLLQIFADLFKGLSGLTKMLKPLIDIIKGGFSFAISIISVVLKAVAATILATARAIGGAWNGILDGINAYLKKLSEIGVHYLDDYSKSLESMRVDTDAIDESMRALWDSTDANTQAQTSQAAAVEKATEALSNVPTGYKMALARFNADQGFGFTGTPSLSGGGGSGSINIQELHVQADDPEELARELAELKRKKNSRRDE